MRGNVHPSTSGGRIEALRDIETTLISQGKIRSHNAKYATRFDDPKTPYCKWLDTTKAYRIRKAFATLVLPDSIVPDEDLERA